VDERFVAALAGGVVPLAFMSTHSRIDDVLRVQARSDEREADAG
jgi:hypothetical protein